MDLSFVSVSVHHHLSFSTSHGSSWKRFDVAALEDSEPTMLKIKEAVH